MLKKGTKLNSILTGSCPKCQNESMYVDTNPYHLSETLKMHERCSHCHLKYMIEPSFFYGSMYVSYAVGVAVSTAIFVISFLILRLSLLTSFASIFVGLIVLLPFILRVSRNIWINIFIKYQRG